MLYFNSAFVLLVIGIASSAVRLKNCVMTVGIKKYKLTIKKKGKKHDKTVKYLNFSEFDWLIYNNVLKEYDDRKEAIKNHKTIKKYGWYNKVNINLRKRV